MPSKQSYEVLSLTSKEGVGSGLCEQNYPDHTSESDLTGRGKVREGEKHQKRKIWPVGGKSSSIGQVGTEKPEP